MENCKVCIRWANGRESLVEEGADWLKVAEAASFKIQTGCLGGSCGACEIEVNGKPLRACINSVSQLDGEVQYVEYAEDPFW